MDEMDNLADLKVALHPADGPTDELRARALAFLGNRDASHGSSRRRGVGPTLAAVGVVLLVAGALVLFSPRHFGAVTLEPAAFAVHVNGDGSVTLTAQDVIDTGTATQALNDAGIAGRVVNDITPGCMTKSADIAPADLYPDNTISRGLGSSNTVTVRSTDYPTGGGLLVVVTSRGEDSGRAGVAPDPVSVAIFAFDDAGKIPTCVDFADPGSG